MVQEKLVLLLCTLFVVASNPAAETTRLRLNETVTADAPVADASVADASVVGR